ncbi:MAG: hypothetical protein HY064_04215 [Bacteroidetes bacterium]|nr:hypothetical protein [Bacteroidota bacterium]
MNFSHNIHKYILFIIAPVLAVVVFIGIQFLRNKKIRYAWKNLSLIGAKYGIPLPMKAVTFFKPVYPQLSGTTGNVKLIVNTERETDDSGGNYKTTVIIIQTQRAKFKFELCKKSLLNKLQRLFADDPVETGNTDFDKHFILNSNNPPLMPSYFNSNICVLLLNNMHLVEGTISFDFDTIFYSENTIISDDEKRERFSALIDLLVKVSLHMTTPLKR